MICAEQCDWCPIRTAQVPQIRFSHIADYSHNQSFAILWNVPHFEQSEYWRKTTSEHQDEIRGLPAIRCPKHKLQNSKSNYPRRHRCEQPKKTQHHPVTSEISQNICWGNSFQIRLGEQTKRMWITLTNSFTPVFKQKITCFVCNG